MTYGVPPEIVDIDVGPTPAVGVLVLVAVGVYAVLHVIRHRHFRQGVLRKPPGKALRIIIMGFKESGKTVFLASMFHELSMVNEAGFQVTTNDRLRRRLEGVYAEMTKSERSRLPITFSAALSTPTGKWELQRYDFVGRVRGPGAKDYRVVEFLYYDYAGELFEDIIDGRDSNRHRELKADMLRADLALAVLDGRKVRDYLRNGRHDEFEREVRKLLAFIVDAEVPVHFMITKWDLLEAKGYSLQETVQGLEGIPGFRDFLINYSRDNLIRIIPVSAVGPGYLRTIGRYTFRSRKGRPQPINVEVPLMTALPDILAHHLRQAEGPVSTRRQIHRLFSGDLRYLAWVLTVIMFPALEGIRSIPGLLEGGEGGRRGPDETRKASSDGGQPRDHHAALRRVFLLFDRRLRRFEEEFPGACVRTSSEWVEQPADRFREGLR